MRSTLFLLILLFCSPLLAEPIRDIQKNTPGYKAIKRSVDGGYLSLQKGQKFNGNAPVKRQELAIVIDTLLNDIKKRNPHLTQIQIAELKTLSNSYKSVFADYDTTLSDLKEKYRLNEEENRVLHDDISRLTEQQDQLNLYYWLGIGAAAIIGVAL